MLRLWTFPVSVFVIQLGFAAAILSVSQGAAAQTAVAEAKIEARATAVGESEPEEVEKANKWTVGLVGGTVRHGMMAERGISVDHSTIHRWVVHFAPLLLEVLFQMPM